MIKIKAVSANYTAHENKKRNYNRKFNKTLLPKPIDYYLTIFRKVHYMGNSKIRVHCCFHDDSTPSLLINTVTGSFFCFGCGAKGGDLIDFYCKINHTSFYEAVTAFDAWEVV